MKQRIYSLELLRIICSIFVIAVHVFMELLFLDARQDAFVGFSAFLFIGAVVRVCVPGFFMITGFFMFRKDKSFGSIIKYCTKRLILPTMFLCVIIFVFADWFYDTKGLLECITQHSGAEWWQFIKDMLLRHEMPSPHNWLWYIGALLRIYLFYPLLKYICVNRKEENFVRRALMLLCFISTMLIPSIQAFFPEFQAYVMTALPFNDFVYILLGYELSLLYERQAKCINPFLGGALFLVGSTFTYLFTKYIDVPKDGYFSHTFFEYYNLSVVVASVGMMLFFLSFRIPASKTLSAISGRTFIAYLVHFLVIVRFKSIGFEAWLVQTFGFVGGAFIETGLVFLISLGISFLCRYISILWKFCCQKCRAYGHKEQQTET